MNRATLSAHEAGAVRSVLTSTGRDRFGFRNHDVVALETRLQEAIEADMAAVSGDKLTTWRAIITKDPNWPFIDENTPMDWPADDDAQENCKHSWAYTGTAYGGDDESYHGEGRSYCEHCGADGDA